MNEETQIQSEIAPEVEFAELKKFMAEHGYRKLSGAQRARWKILKGMFDPEEVKPTPILASMSAERINELTAQPGVVLPAVSKPAPLSDDEKLIANTHKLMAVHGEIKDADDKGRLTSLFGQKDLLTHGSDDQIFQAAFKLISDGNSRAVLRKYFPQNEEL